MPRPFIFRQIAAALVAVLVVACRNKGGPPAPADGPCAAACRKLIIAGCDRDGLREADLASCEAACRKAGREASRTECGGTHASYLECAARSGLSCERARCSAAVCLAHHIGIQGCGEEYGAYRACRSPCEDVGATASLERELTHGGRTERVRFTVVRAGCGTGTKPESGAPVGSACETDSVCAQHLCECAGRRAAFLVRACAAAKCADKEQACRAGESASIAPCAKRR